MAGIIPLKLLNDTFTSIKERDKNMIAFAIVFGVRNDVAYLMFHPEYNNGRDKLADVGKKACDMFFSHSVVSEYANAYRKQIKQMKGALEAPEQSQNVGDSNSKERTDKAVRKLVNDTLCAIESNSEFDPELLKDLADLAKRLGILKEEEVKIEPPRRYLAEVCSQCRYRYCVEEALINGLAIDECKYCKALKFAQENGFKYDPTTMLDIKDTSVVE